MGYYSTIKRNEAPVPATAWINLKNYPKRKPDTTDHVLCDSIRMECPEFIETGD